jgi:cytochrome b561
MAANSQSGKPLMVYSRCTRITHAAIAFSITFQMFVSLVMDHPRTSRAMAWPGSLFFRWHEWVGLAALIVLALSWAYRGTSAGRSTGTRLFPWASAARLREIVVDLRNFVCLRWALLSEESALSGTIHGFGLLLATALAITGGAMYVELWPADVLTPTGRSIMRVHSFLSTFMWIYLGGHVAMALWHEYIGHGTLRRMFSFGRRSEGTHAAGTSSGTSSAC